ncbi:MAG: hypothetical protein HZY76_00755 [Anaerolineae bacterium]|nr:MAG: hypothetical protein HZY76_00755 [Anaerolineae bacterium]
MKRHFLSLILAAALMLLPAAAFLGPLTPAASATPALQPPRPRYTVIDLGGCEALAISNNGKVAGQCGSGSSARGFFWENGVMQSLGTLGGSWSIAYGVNDAGQVVGTSLAGSGYSGAFLWQNGAMQSLETAGRQRAIGRWQSTTPARWSVFRPTAPRRCTPSCGTAA